MNLNTQQPATGSFKGFNYWVADCNGDTYFQTDGMFKAQYVTSEALGIQGALQLKELIKRTISMLLE